MMESSKDYYNISDYQSYSDLSDYPFESIPNNNQLIENESWVSLICRLLARYYVAIVILFGVFGNLGCLMCYRKWEDLKKYRSTTYLMALALSDLTFLICLSFVWLKSIGVNWQDLNGICQSSIYASNLSIFLSAWYVMALTGEMAYALHRPYTVYANAIEARKTVLIRICLVTIIGLATNSWTLALTKSGTTVEVDLGSMQIGEIDQVHLDLGATVTPAGELDQQTHFDLGVTSSVDHIDQAHVSSEDQILPIQDLSTIFNYSWKFPPFLYTHTIGCHISSDDQFLHTVFVLMDISLTYSIPLLITLLLNCYIGYELIQAGRRRREMGHSRLLTQIPMKTIKHSWINRNGRYAKQLNHAPFTGSQLNRLRGLYASRDRWNGRYKETTISSLLIAKSMAYLIFNTPSCAHRIWSMLKRRAITEAADGNSETTTSVRGNEENWLQLIIYILFYTQFSINFLLYSYHAYAGRQRKAGGIVKHGPG